MEKQTLTPKDYYRKYSPFLFPFLVLILVIVLFPRLVQPNFGILFQSYQELKKGQERLESLKTKASELENLEKEDLTEKGRKVNSLLPSEKDIGGILLALERAMAETRASIQALSFTPGTLATESASPKKKTTSVSPPQDLEVNLILNGDSSAISRFLTKISTSSPLASVKRLDFTPASSSLTLIFYYQPQPSSLGEIGEPIPKLTPLEEKVYNQIAQFEIPVFVSPLVSPEATPGRRSNPFSF